jgi:hypothetical protein
MPNFTARIRFAPRLAAADADERACAGVFVGVGLGSAAEEREESTAGRKA